METDRVIISTDETFGHRAVTDHFTQISTGQVRNLTKTSTTINCKIPDNNYFFLLESLFHLSPHPGTIFNDFMIPRICQSRSPKFFIVKSLRISDIIHKSRVADDLLKMKQSVLLTNKA